MPDRRLSAMIAGLAVFLICAILWDAFYTPSTRPRPLRGVVTVTDSAKPDSAAPAPHADSVLPAGTAANFQPAFLDAVRSAFQRWEEAAVPVRFDVDADSEHAEVRFRWKVQFDIDRTGQTDLTWDQEGRLLSGAVTIATFDPKGRPLSADDVRVVALHEIGHLIGLDHSSDSNDLMFANTKVRDLSPRDIRSAAMLYRLAPGSVR